jgi:hypothetical protein
MANGADSANPLHQGRHLVERPPFAEFLEASELRDVELSVGYLASIIKTYRNLPMTLDAGYGLYFYMLSHEKTSYTGLSPKTGFSGEVGNLPFQ